LASVLEAVDLRPTDQDGVPDPYCEVTIGQYLFRTDTQFNTPDPLWDETFTSDFDQSVYSVFFQMYDQNEYSFSDLRIGYVEVDVGSLDEDKRYVEWLTLNSNAGDNSTSGLLKVALYIAPAKQPGYEMALLIVGIVLTFSSLFLGVYTWRLPSRQKKLS